MQLTSTTFADGDTIPVQYTRDTSNFSPGLEWTDPPGTTQSFAVLCLNRDAPAAQSIHWLVYNIPPQAYMLAPKIAHQPQHPSGLRQAANSWKEFGYTGPQAGNAIQHYVFTLFALDTPLSLAPETNRNTLHAHMEKHCLATATLTGLY